MLRASKAIILNNYYNTGLVFISMTFQRSTNLIIRFVGIFEHFENDFDLRTLYLQPNPILILCRQWQTIPARYLLPFSNRRILARPTLPSQSKVSVFLVTTRREYICQMKQSILVKSLSLMIVCSNEQNESQISFFFLSFPFLAFVLSVLQFSELKPKFTNASSSKAKWVNTFFSLFFCIFHSK